MIYLLSQSWAADNSKGLAEKIIPHLGLSLDQVRFVDTSYEDIDVNKFNAMVCFDKSYKDVAKAFTSAGIFKIRDLIGKDVISEDGSFLLFNVPFTLTQIFTNENSKAVAWEKLQTFVTAYNQFYSDENITQEVEVETEVISSEQKEVVQEESNEQIVQIDVGVFLQTLVEALDLSDPAIGKTLGLSSKVVLTTDNGDVTIHPTGDRIPKDGQAAHLSIKDTIALLKTCLVFDAKMISFYQKQT